MNPTRLAFALLLSLSSIPRNAIAEPQVSAALLPGIALSPQRPRVAFHGGAHVDVILGRTRDGTFGAGPSLDVSSVAFEDLRLTPGVALQLPTDPIALLLSAGPLLQIQHGAHFGGSARLFIGSRAYNYFSHYAPALGVALGVDIIPKAQQELVGFASLHVDLGWIALPFVIAGNWLRGSTRAE